MLYLVGLGLADETDITVKGLNIVKKADRVYLEAYTSILMVDKDKLEAYYERPIIVADREMVESNDDDILAKADVEDVAFLVVGDPFGATTHSDLVLRAHQLHIPIQIVHNASVMSAVGATGLQLYNFGQTVSMVFFTDTWKPSSFYDRVRENRQIGLHTLMLLDIKVKEQSEENLARGRKIFEPPRFMTAGQCAAQMLEIEESRGEGAYAPGSLAVAVARLGAPNQQMVAGTLKQISVTDLGAPLHSLVLLGKAHDLERFRWSRGDIRIHTIIHEVDDAAPNNLMAGDSERAMRENFKELYPGAMKHLPHLRFIEPLNPNAEKFAYPAEPHVFICDVVVRSEDYIDITKEMANGIPQVVWDAMAELRDAIAKDEGIGWYAVHNGDLELAKQEREARDEEDAGEEHDDEADRIQEERNIKENFSQGLKEGVARLQVDNAGPEQGGRGALEQANDFAGTWGVVIVGRLLQMSSSDSFPMFTVIWATRCILQAMRGDCALGIHGIGLQWSKIILDPSRSDPTHGLPRKLPEAMDPLSAELVARTIDSGDRFQWVRKLETLIGPAHSDSCPKKPYPGLLSSSTASDPTGSEIAIYKRMVIHLREWNIEYEWRHILVIGIHVTGSDDVAYGIQARNSPRLGRAILNEAIVTVDGISYEYLGSGSTTLPKIPNLRPAKPLTVTYDSQYSNFTFAAGPVEVTASFLSSVLPTDLCRTSVPLSYLTTSVRSTDSASHDVQFYSDVNAAWAASENNVTIQWELYEGSNMINASGDAAGDPSSIYSWFFYLQQAYEFAEEMDVALWGNFTYSSSPMGAQNFSVDSGFSGDVRYQYVMQHSLPGNMDSDYRPFATREPVFAYSHDFGPVSSASVRYTIGSVQQPIIRYLSSEGVVPLQPWWIQCYGDVHQMINFHFNDFGQTQVLASRFESQLKADVDGYYGANMAMVYSNSTPSTPPPYANTTQAYNGTDEYGNNYIFDSGNGYGFLDPQNFTGIAIPDVQEAEAYYSIVALSARQIMGAYTLAIPPSSGAGFNSTGNATDPLMFQKEISSNGNTNTVDVMFPAMPFFLYANPNLLIYTMEPLYQNQEGGFYPNQYSMHDLGSHYPNATGHVEGNDEYMPVEESGNMILMSYAYYKFTSNTTYLTAHYPKLQQFASYLLDFTLTPGKQLSTDDFAGQLVNQTNLAIKGIVGIAAMSEIALLCSDPAASASYAATAASYYAQWETFALDPARTHTLLSYQWRSSYSLLYNVYPALLLDLPIIPDSLYALQSAFYPSVSQLFGVPLDNRHSYTKSDESLWTAATCAPETRRLFVNGLAYWLNVTSTDRAFSDLFETVGEGGYPVSPDPVFFIARPVAGGHFSLLALEKGRGMFGRG
ncbi:MAG: hypothetical protein Q9206_006037 [Seirophora lacunosa]